MSKSADRQTEARAWLAGLSKRALARADDRDLARFNLPYDVDQTLLYGERLRRGVITLADVPQRFRRALVDPASLDLHLLAAGPIMDSDKIYLPAGKCSLEEAVRREGLAIDPSPSPTLPR